jgi:peptidoglycan-associated lipoprotein
MIYSYRPLVRTLLVSFAFLALFISGCNKKPVAASKPSYTPPASSVKPTVTFTADRTSINRGESVKLSWTTTDATNVSIAPEVGAVTPQGSTTVTPSESTIYTLTASSGGGNTDAIVRISVNGPSTAATVREAPRSSTQDELFLKEVHDAFFDYNAADIRPDARDVLRKDADFLKSYPNMRVTIEGHCDERGSTEYNLALGQRRANAVKDYLVSLGIPADRLATTSWGKEKPFCSESTEACWQLNRRGHFTLNRNQ